VKVIIISALTVNSKLTVKSDFCYALPENSVVLYCCPYTC